MHDFFSSDIEGFRVQTRTQFDGACQRCLQLSAEAAEQLAYLTFPGRSAAECIAIAFWSKCVRACQASFLLVERGMVADAQATLRGAVETLFHAVALVRKPGVLERLREHDDAEKRKQVEKMFQHKDIRAALSDEDKGRLQVLSALPKGNPFSVLDAAAAAKMTHLYEMLYRTLSQNAAHSTLTSLNHELTSKEAGGPRLRFGPTNDQLEWTINQIAECFSAGIYVMEELRRRE
ncbi:DUF5677 domain-containing protein [Herbaspirillum seropedicae]|uniref:DUF5677 domain-containing protein n=1 Tax=Herbaspirillum seropedicae TaxID=964 RepID=UPI00285CDCF7|nr:DUF5677 domain-containing protein [Herbaspirillum seropedicae]MDR6397914.1 hypothetical protein [Herbaspirillum seropedicae]